MQFSLVTPSRKLWKPFPSKSSLTLFNFFNLFKVYIELKRMKLSYLTMIVIYFVKVIKHSLQCSESCLSFELDCNFCDLTFKKLSFFFEIVRIHNKMSLFDNLQFARYISFIYYFVCVETLRFEYLSLNKYKFLVLTFWEIYFL